jgi:hypothetical protein
MTVLCNIYKSVEDLLPHFFSHYISFGVSEFIFAIHGGLDGPLTTQIRDLSPPNISVELETSYHGAICGSKEGESLNKLRLQAKTEWIIPTDLDEFHIPCGFESFQRLSEEIKKENAFYVKSFLYDMITEDGSVPLKIDRFTPIHAQFPKHYDITRNILNAYNQKVALSRQIDNLTDGHHGIGPARCADHSVKWFSILTKTHHYKWFGDLWKKEEEKFISYREKGYNYHEENLRLLDLLRTNNGKLL